MQNKIKEALERRFENGFIIETATVTKNNNVKKEGIIIRKKEENCAPTFYVDSTKTIDENVEAIFNAYKNLPSAPFKTDLSDMTDLELMNAKIFFCIRNASTNKDDAVTNPIQGTSLEYIYRCFFSEEATFIIKESMLKIWGINKEQLHKIAVANTPLLQKEKVESLQDILGISAPADIPVPPNMYVVTNTTGIYGASVICYPGMGEKLCDIFGKDEVILIPSSIHELIALDIDDAEALPYMIEDVNETMLNPEEVLGNTPLKINRAGELRMAI